MNLKKLSIVFASIVVPVTVCCGDYDGDVDFQEVSEPASKISGAYYGLGFTLSSITHKLNVYRNRNGNLYHKHSENQCDISLISGFGTTIYSCYAGIEFDLYKRLSKKTHNETETALEYKSNIGLNMDVRFGYQPKYARTLYYGTFGFSRIVGNMINRASAEKMSFGSFFPTIGCGVEHKINQSWNVRGDARWTIGSKEKKYSRMRGEEATFEVKPSRYAFRISVVKSI